MYVDYMLNDCMSEAFAAFQEGFDTITQGTAMVLFRAEELQELIGGSSSLDFHDLEKSTKYDGFEADNVVIKYV
jgi:HECT-domain (ubiquitin-transferase)